MSWKLAGSLIQLRNQINAGAPNRGKKSDGAKASADHTKANPNSDHEPWYVRGGIKYVTAIDITHDPANGMDCDLLFDVLWASRDPRIKYVIWDRHIMAGNAGPYPWATRNYNGKNPHTQHLHISVMPNATSLMQAEWNLGNLFMAINELTPDKLWGFPVHDLYTTAPDDTLTAGVALEWAAANAGIAKDNASAALTVAQRVEAKLDRVLALEDLVVRIADHIGVQR